MQGKPSTTATNQKLNAIVDGLAGQSTGSATVEKNYHWYEQNDPEALLKMQADDNEQFMKLFNAQFK